MLKVGLGKGTVYTFELIDMLQAGKAVSAKDLAEKLDVSVRTVRFHIHQANESMGEVAHIVFSRQHNGYCLDVKDETAFETWLAHNRQIAGSNLYTMSETRSLYLLIDLLRRSDWVTISLLADALNVSTQSISSDLKAVEEDLDQFGLMLERRPRYGLRISGPEIAHRLCLTYALSKQVDILSDVWGPENRKLSAQIAECTDQVLSDTDIHIGSSVSQSLIVHLAVAVLRIRQGCIVQFDEENLRALQEAEEYPVAKRLAEAIAQSVDATFPPEEIAYITVHLAGKRTLAEMVDSGIANAPGESNAISDHVWNTVGEMLDRVWDSFHIDFRNDLELRMNLARHLAPLFVRLTYGLRLENPLLIDIKTRYPLAYSIAVDASTVLVEAKDSTELSEDEMGYLALAFALALERARTGAAKKNVLMVCASGEGTARMLEYRFQRAYAGYIETITTCDINRLKKQDFSKIDYVFTTVPIHEALPVPVCEIGTFFEDSNTDDINRLFRQGATSNDFISHFSRELFFAHLDFKTNSEVISFLCDRMTEAIELDSGFKESVLAREAAAATTFGNLVAMPHPFKAASDQTYVSVGLLDHPIVWGKSKHNVQLVFLFSYARAGGRALDNFFSVCADVFMDTDAMKRLAQDQTWETLESILTGR